DDGQTPDSNAYLMRDVFTVAQKTSHNAVTIIFKLSSRIDQQGSMIPRRQILRDVCGHTYRFWNEATGALDYSKASCPYTGRAPFDVNDLPTDSMHDQCSHTLAGCTLRFGSAPLPARLFPGVGKVR